LSLGPLGGAAGRDGAEGKLAESKGGGKKHFEREEKKRGGNGKSEKREGQRRASYSQMNRRANPNAD